MRILLGILLLIICTYIGYIKSNKYYLRRVFYDDFIRFNDKLKQEVAFKQGTIKDLLDNEQTETDFIKYLKASFVQKQNLALDINYLNEFEVKHYKEYVSKIGSGDKSLQMDFLQGVNEDLVKKQKQTVLDEEKYKKLYVKLGFFIGLILLILVL